MRQFWVSIETRARRAHSVTAATELEGVGEVDQNQAATLQNANMFEISDTALRAGFPSVDYVGSQPEDQSNKRKSPEAAEAEAEQKRKEEEAKKKARKNKKERPDITGELPVMTPQTAKEVQAEWVRQLLHDISSMTSCAVQLKGQSFSNELVTSIETTIQQLQAAHAAWAGLRGPLDTAVVGKMCEDHRELILQVKRLQAKSQALLREPAEGKPRKKQKKGSAAEVAV